MFLLFLLDKQIAFIEHRAGFVEVAAHARKRVVAGGCPANKCHPPRQVVEEKLGSDVFCAGLLSSAANTQKDSFDVLACA